MTKADIATQEYQGNYNCSQSTFAVFVEDYGLDQKTAFRIGAGYGGGCHYGEVCGSVLAGCAIVGLKYGNDEPDPEQYSYCRDKTREFMEKIRDHFGTATCSGLLGIDMVDPEGREKAREQGLFDTRCKEIVKYVVETLESLGY